MTKTQGNAGGTLLRRTILLLAVAAVVAAMTVAMAAPAFAARHKGGGAVFSYTNGTTTDPAPASTKHELEKQGYTCTKEEVRI